MAPSFVIDGHVGKNCLAFTTGSRRTITLAFPSRVLLHEESQPLTQLTDLIGNNEQRGGAPSLPPEVAGPCVKVTRDILTKLDESTISFHGTRKHTSGRDVKQKHPH